MSGMRDSRAAVRKVVALPKSTSIFSSTVLRIMGRMTPALDRQGRKEGRKTPQALMGLIIAHEHEPSFLQTILPFSHLSTHSFISSHQQGQTVPARTPAPITPPAEASRSVTTVSLSAMMLSSKPSMTPRICFLYPG